MEPSKAELESLPSAEAAVLGLDSPGTERTLFLKCKAALWWRNVVHTTLLSRCLTWLVYQASQPIPNTLFLIFGSQWSSET